MTNKNLAIITSAVIVLLLLFVVFNQSPVDSPANHSIENSGSEKATQNNTNIEQPSNKLGPSSKQKFEASTEIANKKEKHPYIVQCSEYEITEEDKERNLVFDEKLNDYLSQSNLENDRFIDALFFHSNEYASSTESLFNFTKEYPNNRFGQLSLLNHCISKSSDRNFCNRIDIEKIERFAEDNGMFWFNLALMYDVNQKPDLTEEALKQSLNSPIFSFYFGEIASFINEAYLRAGEPNDSFTKIAAFGYTATIPMPHLSQFHKLCTNRSEKDFEFYELCMEVSNQLTKKGDTVILANFGEQFSLSLKQKHQKLIGVELDDAAKNVNAFSEETMKLMSFSSLLMYDDQLSEFWLNATIKYGEIEAIKMTYNEAIRLSKNPNYNPCPE